ncbi:MAG: aminodeoxychorismate synthase component I [Bacteroidales bacterium]|nr:aminodeoxychorismate synthase component I [Bacteroidales bacterium]
MGRQEMIRLMNEAGRDGTPFLFVIDFSGEESIFLPLKHPSNEFYFSTPFYQHIPNGMTDNRPFRFEKHPIPFEQYKKSFDLVQRAIRRGDSFLVNLTFPTRIETDLTLQEIFMRSKAPYRLLISNKFVCFSPESFVKIVGNTIYSYPMKGTIDASIPNAEKLILEDAKEKAEHYTIVDLIRNDLSRVAEQVEVKRFRYVERVETNGKSLLQVSSEIVGQLAEGFRCTLGEMLFSMLPAGSISGAPKDSTLNIIRRAEMDNRGFYTGIFGIFDGKNLDSAVIIRYIEECEGKKQFRSGGGITSRSNAESEYQELIDKVYVPFA